MIRPDGIYVDGTVGGGGHARGILSELTGGGRLIGIDEDDAAIEASSERLACFGDKVTLVRSNFSEMPEILSEMGIKGVDGILLDLGVSSFQFDTPERGFTYREDVPLDMRLDRRQELTARDVVNSYSEGELTRIIRDYGEERYAASIAAHIVSARKRKPVETTGELTAIIRASIPAKAREHGPHPAKRTFQAIRIEVNSELKVLEDTLNNVISLLNDHGRLCVITFHSLEDRIVKNIFNTGEHPCTCPPDFPVCIGGKKPLGRVVTKKPVVPSEEEIAANRRSRSAKLRVFERILK